MNEHESNRWHFVNLEHIKLDTSRKLRTGFPEAILARGKTIDQLLNIIKFHLDNNTDLFITRCDFTQIAALKEIHSELTFDELTGCVWIEFQPREILQGKVRILTGGSSDYRIAREVQITLHLNGAEDVEIISDIGVSNINRCISYLEQYEKANVLIVCAGMEGALPSVVAGLVSGVIIAVPTSGGTGGELAGLPALLAMLNSCAPGVAVVNIDGGYQAACVALRVLTLNQHT
jgi:pyridinium-3,5-biscarboxylic acid mononucleotide synthase